MAKYDDIEIIYKNDNPYGIRDKGGYLLFFHGVDRYSGQEERYKREIEQLTELANYLLGALQKIPSGQ